MKRFHFLFIFSAGHDESTFRSGEMTAKRWLNDAQEPFFSKGRGRSFMIFDFIVSHPSGPFLKLNDKEWADAIEKYPGLLISDDIDYIKQTATATMHAGTGLYFDNDTILSQFEKLFQILQFKTEYKGHHVDVLIDHERTHTAREYSVGDFGKNINTKCPVNQIEYYDENGVHQVVKCYFQSGENRNKSKGLLQIAKELSISILPKCKLVQLREIIGQHPAFQTVCIVWPIFFNIITDSSFKKTKLENLAEKYGIRVIYCPKFHCELNPIEGLWCSMKTYVRKRTDQRYSTMLRLIEEARTHFVNIGLYKKLFRRFWKTCEACKDGQTYGSILKLFYSTHCKENVISHRKISNTSVG